MKIKAKPNVTLSDNDIKVLNKIIDMWQDAFILSHPMKDNFSYSWLANSLRVKRKLEKGLEHHKTELVQ